MNQLYYDENIAINLYKACADMDQADYTENKNNDIQLLDDAISKILSYASYNDNFKALYTALYMLYSE